MPGRFTYSPSCLEEILAEMVKSAISWDENHGQDTENSPQDEELTRIPRHIHCSPLDKNTKQKLSESEDEDGHRNQDGESSVDV